MEEKEFIKQMNDGTLVVGDSDLHKCMRELSQQALKITAEINCCYHTPEELSELMAKLTGNECDYTLRVFPPFNTDCGRNIHFGKNVFVNSNCCFQDQGGIFIGDNTLIGHNVVLATLNHGLLPTERKNLIPKKIVIGKNVWIGSSSVILGGVTIGDNAVIGAGSVVTKDVPENMIAVGNPARVIKSIFDKGE